MAHFHGLEAAYTQLQPYPTQLTELDKFSNQDLLTNIKMFSDEYSVIEPEHPNMVDIQVPSQNPFRWEIIGTRQPNIIFDKSGRFGPMRAVELEVNPIEDFHFEFNIKRVHLLKKTDGDCIEHVRREHSVEGLKVRLFYGEIFNNSHFDSMSYLFDPEYDWEDRPEFQIFALVQYWAFHHPEVVHQLQWKEISDA